MSQSLLRYFGWSLLFMLLFGGGFYFGYKTSSAQTNEKSFSLLEAQAQGKADAVALTQQSSAVTPKEVDGVQWIIPGQKPECDTNHTIKGKFDKNTNYFYAPGHKSWEKVIPQICFATEDFAQSKGFLKKF
jgi:hypothetical protein